MLRNTATTTTNMITPPASPPTAAAAASTYKAYLRPTWFIQRADSGAYIPVIPVDELPPGVDLEEAPRRLTEDGAQGMTFLGKLPFSGQTYSLVVKQQEHTTTITNHPMMDDAKRDRYPLQHRTCSQTSLRPLILGESIVKQREQQRPHPAAAASANADDNDDNDDAHTPPRRDITTTLTTKPRLPPSGREPDPAKKEYCTYWIRTGECDFTQQGCLFKHEMPDLRTLREKVGVGAVPHWYQMKCAMERSRKDGNDVGGKGVGETPAWLVETVGRVRREGGGCEVVEEEEEEEGDDEDSGDDEASVGMARTPPPSSLSMSPPGVAGAVQDVVDAINAASRPRVFRSPDHAVRRSRGAEDDANAVVMDTAPSSSKETGQTSQQHQRHLSRSDERSSRILTSLPAPPSTSPNTHTKVTTATKPSPPLPPPSSSMNKRRHTFLSTASSPATTTTARPHARSISDAQADIVNRMSHHRTVTTPTVNTPNTVPIPNNHRRSEPPVAATPTPTPTPTSAATTTKRKSGSCSALPQMKRHLPPTPTSAPTEKKRSVVTSTSTSAAATPAAAAAAGQGVGVGGGLRASRHAVVDDDVPSFEPARVAVLAEGVGAGVAGAGKGKGQGQAQMQAKMGRATRVPVRAGAGSGAGGAVGLRKRVAAVV